MEITGTVPVKLDLDLSGVMEVPAGAVLNVTGTLTLESTSTFVNSGTTTAGSCVKEAGATGDCP